MIARRSRASCVNPSGGVKIQANGEGVRSIARGEWRRSVPEASGAWGVSALHDFRNVLDHTPLPNGPCCVPTGNRRSLTRSSVERGADAGR